MSLGGGVGGGTVHRSEPARQENEWDAGNAKNGDHVKGVEVAEQRRLAIDRQFKDAERAMGGILWYRPIQP